MVGYGIESAESCSHSDSDLFDFSYFSEKLHKKKYRKQATNKRKFLQVQNLALDHKYSRNHPD